MFVKLISSFASASCDFYVSGAVHKRLLHKIEKIVHLPPCPQNVRSGQPPPSDYGRLLWTAPYNEYHFRPFTFFLCSVCYFK